MTLVHAVDNKVEAAYRRDDLFEKRQLICSTRLEQIFNCRAQFISTERLFEGNRGA